jgi:hypothetical protein
LKKAEQIKYTRETAEEFKVKIGSTQKKILSSPLTVDGLMMNDLLFLLRSGMSRKDATLF